MADSGSPFDFGRYGERPAARPEMAPFTPATQPARFTDDAPPPTDAAEAVGRPPLVWVALGCASGVLGGLVATVWGGSLTPALVGWLLAGPVAIGLLAFFTARDTLERARPAYAGPRWTTLAYRVCLTVALLGLLLAAYRIADVVAR